MQKKSFDRLQFLFSLFFISCMFFSCSNIQQEKRLDDDSLSLRELTAEMAKNIPWTGELEGNRLTAEIGTQAGISRSVNLSPLVMLVGGGDRDMLPVYPFLKDFGSLDTSLLSEDVSKVLDDFCRAVSHGQSADSFMAVGCLYQLALFIRDMQLDLPEKPAENASENTSEKKSDTEAKETVSFFDSFFYGQPYATGSMYEVPVRFSGRERSADVLIFLSKENGSWKVDELQILQSEQKNGGK